MANRPSLPALFMALILLCSSGAMPAFWGAPAAAIPSDADGRPADSARSARETIFYMNKTAVPPTIDTVWDGANWAKGRMYDISSGLPGQCLMYIMFSGNRLYVGLDVVGDTTNDVTNNDVVLIGLDGENDGVITYNNPTGDQAGVVFPMTMGGPCKDRWAQLFGSNANEAGWLNLDGAHGNSPQLWRVTGGFEHTDQMRAGFSAHRFYEYSMDFRYEMGQTAGAGSLFGLNIRVSDGGSTRGLVPSNYSDIGGPWAQFALAQAPQAVIRSPLAGERFYQNDSIDFDGSNSTDDDPSRLAYKWTFDDGGTSADKVTSRSFGGLGPHIATLEVTDADGLNSSAKVSFVVRQRNEPPVIAYLYPPLDPVINETESLTFSVNLTDPNLDVSGDTLNVTWTVNDTRVKSGIRVRSSAYTFNSNYDGPNSAGTYTVTVSVQDSYDGGWPEPVTHTWTLAVNNRNRPPIITSVSPEVDELSAQEGTGLNFTLLEKIDPDGDPMTLMWYLDNESLPGSRNRDSILLDLDYNSSGVHVLKAAVSDNQGGRTERAWVLYVKNIDRAPAITLASPTSQEVTVREGNATTFSVTRSDPDGDPLTIQWYLNLEPVPDSNSTSFTFHASYEGDNSSDNSPYTIKVVVKDPYGLTAERTWQLEVDDVNRPPIAVISEPEDESEFRLGSTVKLRAEGSRDPDSKDNSSLVFFWDFDDGKTGYGKAVSHKYERTGYYTVRLTVRDRITSVSTLVHFYIRAAVLWVTELVLAPPLHQEEDKPVNITVRVWNNGDAEAKNVKVKLSLDGLLLTTFTIPAIPPGEKRDASYNWTAILGDHNLSASIEPAADIVVPEGSSSRKGLTVQARPPAPAAELPGWAVPLAGALIAMVVLAAVAWAVRSRRRKAAGRAPSAPSAAGPPATPQAAATVPTPPLPSPGPATSIVPGPAPAGAAGPPPAESAAPAEAPTAPAGAPPSVDEAQPPAPEIAPAPPTAPASFAPSAPVQGEAAAAAAACPACGEPVETGWGVCPACGGALTVPQERKAAEAAAGETAAGGAMAAPVSPQIPAVAAPGTALPPAPSACAACGAPIEPGWKVCPECGSRLEAAPAEGAPAAPAETGPAAPAGPAFSESVVQLRKRMEVLSAMDKDVSQVRGTLDLAASFHRTGKEDKARKYLEKAQAMLEELDK